MSAVEPGRLVRRGYDSIAEAYLESRRQDSADVHLLDGFIALLPPDPVVLDAGCGAGRPITARLVARATTTIGLDVSVGQLRLARDTVPDAHVVGGDMLHLPLASECFDGACSYYAIIHIPRDLHLAVLRELNRILRPGGIALLCLGASDLPEWHEQYFGTPMYWSHFDAATNLRLVSEAGFEVIERHLVADESSAGANHLFVLAQRPA